MPDARMQMSLVSTVMGNETRTGSPIIDSTCCNDELTHGRTLSKLSKESVSMNQHSYDVTEALRRIRLDTKLSTEDIRAALDNVISMVRAHHRLQQQVIADSIRHLPQFSPRVTARKDPPSPVMNLQKQERKKKEA